MRSRRVSSRRRSTTGSARPSYWRRSGKASRLVASAPRRNARVQFSTWFPRWRRTSRARASTSTADSGLPEGRLHFKASEGRTGLLVSPNNSASEGLELEIIKVPPGGHEAGGAVGKETLLVVLGGRIDLEVDAAAQDHEQGLLANGTAGLVAAWRDLDDLQLEPFRRRVVWADQQSRAALGSFEVEPALRQTTVRR